MTDGLEILLTNDDGIGSPGIRALYDALSGLGTVTTVAPSGDRSAIGRAMSNEVSVSEHELGYAVDGTPVDCVVAGLTDLCPDADLVVSGCNKGANLGEYVLGRSGTVSAAVEAAFFDVPSIATSLYVPVTDVPFHEIETAPDDYTEATQATTYLVKRGIESGVFEYASYLNVNAPLPDGEPAPLEITHPSKRYGMESVRDGGTIALKDRVWEQMDPETIPDPEGSDRYAVVRGRVSVTPLSATHSLASVDPLDTLVDDYPHSLRNFHR